MALRIWGCEFLVEFAYRVPLNRRISILSKNTIWKILALLGFLVLFWAQSMEKYRALRFFSVFIYKENFSIPLKALSMQHLKGFKKCRALNLKFA